MKKNTLLAATLIIGCAFSHSAFAELVTIEDDSKEQTTYRLTVTPATAPEPVLRHRLTSQRHELSSGNAPAYYRRLHAEGRLQGAERRLKEIDAKWYRWVDSETPLDQIPLDKFSRANDVASKMIKDYIRPGTMCRHCDWGLAIDELRGRETVDFILPEFQGMRQLCRMTAIGTRFAIHKGRYRDAIDLLRMNYQMAHDTAEMPFLVCGLIGIAMKGITNDNLRNLVAAPESPNLYWALSEIPGQHHSLRAAARLETSLGLRLFPLLMDAETAQRSPEEWNQLTRNVSDVMGGLGHNAADATGIVKQLEQAGVSLVNHPGYLHAKTRLIDWGFDAKQVEQMPPGQVLAIYSARIYRKHAQALEVAWNLPFWQSLPALETAEQALKTADPLSNAPDREVFPIATILLPALKASRVSAARSEREFASLQLVEAIRMHAAKQGGLPKSLEQIECVPVPLNPTTNRPFDYQCDGETAVILLPPTDGIPRNWRYEISLAKP